MSLTAIGASTPQLTTLAPEHPAPATHQRASYDDGNFCGTPVPHKYPFPPPPPHLGGMVGSIGDALQKLPGIGGSLADALRNLPPMGGNLANVIHDVLGGGGRIRT
jgi:hypothetical protein